MSGKNDLIKNIQSQYDSMVSNAEMSNINITKEWSSFGPFLSWAWPKYKEEFIIHRKDLRKGFSPENCELKKGGKIRGEDLCGQSFGEVKVIERRPERNSSGNVVWKCICLRCREIVYYYGGYVKTKKGPCRTCIKAKIKNKGYS